MKRCLLVLLVLSYLTLFTPIIKMVIPTKSQFDELTAELLHAGLYDPRLRLAIFSLIGTEGGYNLAEESSYRKTTANRLRTIFGKRLAHLTDEQLDTLKKDDVAFYDTVYGNRYGNSNSGDGFKYRGRGYNQLTFKDGYRKYSNAAGVDLVANPEKMNDPKIAMRVLGAYFKEGIKAGQKLGLLRRKFGVDDISQLTTQEQFNRLVCQINAGWGTKISGGIFDAKNQKMDQNAEAIAAKYMNV